MKILCTTDFSTTSVNAINWSLLYLDSLGGGEIEILHCLDIRSRGDMFLDLNVFLKESAEIDMATLLSKLKSKKNTINSKIINASPKLYIPKRAKKIEADFIILGTTGLTNLKNLTIGSVTEYIVKHTKVPVISIPNNATFKKFNKIVLAVDEKLLKRPNSLLGIKKFLIRKRVKLFIAQVYNDSNDYLIIDDEVIKHFKHYHTEITPIQFNESISKTLNSFAAKVNAQLICIIHHKRNWFSSLFHHSVLKEELFNQDLPILILPD